MKKKIISFALAGIFSIAASNVATINVFANDFNNAGSNTQNSGGIGANTRNVDFINRSSPSYQESGSSGNSGFYGGYRNNAADLNTADYYGNTGYSDFGGAGNDYGNTNNEQQYYSSPSNMNNINSPQNPSGYQAVGGAQAQTGSSQNMGGNQQDFNSYSDANLEISPDTYIVRDGDELWIVFGCVKAKLSMLVYTDPELQKERSFQLQKHSSSGDKNSIAIPVIETGK